LHMGDFRTLKDIETAIEGLTTQECAELRSWLEQYDRPQPIDLQLERRISAPGKLTTVYAAR
ncbi:MAG TPA: hypothetical protein VKG25_21190, partial [Bryobacteraceae bacterium]|nr:hypothetical protein [Bryobacteraceae bacterium]